MSNADKKHFMALQKNIDLKTLSNLIVTAIEEEKFFNKAELIPKVKAIINGFKLNLNSTRYNAIEKPSDAARRLRTIEQQEFELKFWKDKFREATCDDTFKTLCKELEDKRKQYGFN